MRYFLLDPVAEMRDAAIAGFGLLAERAKVDAVLLSDLIRDSTRAVGAAMIKEGHGIKDAYVIRCASRGKQNTIVEQIEQAMTMRDVSPSYLGPAIGCALGDGLARGAVTTPGFLDVAPMFGIGDVTPQTGGHAALLAAVDPEDELAALSDSRRGRLIGKSRDWFSAHDISSGWFVSDATLGAALEDAPTAAGARKIVARHLDERRDRWASLFARSALILRHDVSAPPDAWMSFATVAQALEAGREIRKIPVFEDILGQTLEVAAAHAMDDLDDEPELDDKDFEPRDNEAERPGELARLLKGSRLKPD